MPITIQHRHEVINRTIEIKVSSGAEKRITRIQTTYDGFPLGDEQPQPPPSAYSNTYRRQEGLAPGREHVVVVTAWLSDGTFDSSQTRWRDMI